MADSTSHPQGPYASGTVPAGDLEVHRADLRRFGVEELRRMLVVWWVFASTFVVEVARWGMRVGGHRGFDTALAVWVRRSFEQLGPSFIKLGQVIASAPGLFPRVVADECLKLLDSVPPVPLAEVQRTIEEDLGRPIEELVASWDPVPMSAASIAQVHACVLRDGRAAVVKVQRRGLRHDIDRDLRIQYRLASLVNRFERARMLNLPNMIEDLNRTLHEELNFLLEATNQAAFRSRIGYFGDNKWVTAPDVYWELCGPRVLCMERLYGVPLDDFDAIEGREIDSVLLLRRGVKVWIEAAFAHGMFHGDVHAGNTMVLDDGRAAFLDFGICGHLDPVYRAAFVDFFRTYVIDRDWVRLVRAMQSIGMMPAELDAEVVAPAVQMVVEPFVDKPISELSLGAMLTEQLKMADRYDMVGDPVLALIGKQFLYFERYVKRLAPGWSMVTDPYLFRNLFPDEVAAKVDAEGVTLPD
ncbi:MAG: AarF/ABC1/UbiB kinase family protein [Acidimicrobiia bacterium]|nr:AarF/ABC1/UbiB kinase family protein [Acidimicrobiia bacterium]